MLNRIRLAAAAALLLLPAAAGAQTSPIRGDAILTHPIGVLATKTVELIAAGQFDAVMALRTKMDQDEWKTTPAAEKQEFGNRLKARAPSPAAFADLVRTAGELTIDGESASLEASTPAGMLRQAFALEDGQWRVSFGPMFLAEAGAAAPVNITRVEGAELSSHPASAVVLQYADLVHAGKVDEAMARLASADALAKWKTLPASEKAESAAFRARMLPTRDAIAKALASGGVLLVEGETATLNLITMAPATASNSTGTSTTVVIPLTLENGQWKLAQ